MGLCLWDTMALSGSLKQQPCAQGLVRDGPLGPPSGNNYGNAQFSGLQPLSPSWAFPEAQQPWLCGHQINKSQACGLQFPPLYPSSHLTQDALSCGLLFRPCGRPTLLEVRLPVLWHHLGVTPLALDVNTPLLQGN